LISRRHIDSSYPDSGGIFNPARVFASNIPNMVLCISLASMRTLLSVTFLAVTLVAADTPLPGGFDQARWGMTVAELRAGTEVSRVEATDEFGYAEHSEQDPEVYYRVTPRHERIEYYFYRGRLYKIFVIYDRVYFHTNFYEDLVGEMKKSFGPPQKAYSEQIFGLTIQHTRWEDDKAILDLRKGAGFIYQVRIDKAAQLEKERAGARKKSI